MLSEYGPGNSAAIGPNLEGAEQTASSLCDPVRAEGAKVGTEHTRMRLAEPEPASRTRRVCVGRRVLLSRFDPCSGACTEPRLHTTEVRPLRHARRAAARPRVTRGWQGSRSAVPRRRDRSRLRLGFPLRRPLPRKQARGPSPPISAGIRRRPIAAAAAGLSRRGETPARDKNKNKSRYQRRIRVS